MSELVDLINKNAFPIATFTLERDQTLSVEPMFSRQEFIYLGDITYFMFVNDLLVKVGIAGGVGSWAARQSGYVNHFATCRTTIKVIRELMLMEEEEIEVLAIQSPRIAIDHRCPITNIDSIIEVPTHAHIEANLTAMAIAEGFKLEFITQRKFS